MEEGEEQVETGQNRGSLSFFDEGDGQEEVRIGGESAKPVDDIEVSVLSCTKEGNDWSYRIKVRVNGEERDLQRWFKDIQWLHRFLSRNLDLGGHVLPPFIDSPSSLPDLPATTLIGSGEAMFGGVERRHCLRMERFLSELASHRFFSEHHVVKNYLINTDLTTIIKERERLGTGTMWSQVTKVYNDYQLGKIQDPDDTLDSFFKYVCSAIPNLKTGYEMFSTYIFKWQRLACQYAEVRSQLKDTSCVDRNKDVVSCESLYAEVVLDVSATEALVSLDGALTLAATLAHQAYYFMECKEMLLRRLSTHQALVTATQQLDKATKPEKKEIAQKNKDKTELRFNSITETAQVEVELFQKQYRQHLRQSLLSYTEAQVAHSKRTFESLGTLREKLVNQCNGF